jgi:hypothetical protein
LPGINPDKTHSDTRVKCRWLAKQRLHAFIDFVDKNWLRSIDLRRPVKLCDAQRCRKARRPKQLPADSLGFLLASPADRWQSILPWRDDEIAASLPDIDRTRRRQLFRWRQAAL